MCGGRCYSGIVWLRARISLLRDSPDRVVRPSGRVAQRRADASASEPDRHVRRSTRKERTQLTSHSLPARTQCSANVEILAWGTALTCALGVMARSPRH
jgi:hypothetical protein